jgi:hypothetical protein
MELNTLKDLYIHKLKAATDEKLTIAAKKINMAANK